MMKKGPEQRIMEEVIEATGELKPGTVTHILVKHDSSCPAFRTHKMKDCRCKPIIEKVIKQ